MADDKIRKLVEENHHFFTITREHFHRHPELSSQEYETAAYIKKALDEWKIPYETNGVSNIVATIKGPGEDSKKTIAIRGDIDALPIQEETGCAFASENEGVMHACGHDCHATFMLGVAKVLKELQCELKGTVKIIFQEGEEIGAGARKLMASHILDDVDTIAGLHVTQELDLGKFSVGYGVVSSYGAGKQIIVERKESTGSTSTYEHGVNVILAASEIVPAVTASSVYGFPGNQQIALSPTMVKTEGVGKITVTYNFRTLQGENVEIYDYIFDTAPAKIGDLFGVNVRVESWGPGSPVINDQKSTDRAISVIKEYFGKDAAVVSNGMMGGEDFALYQEKIPGVFLHVGGAVNGNYLPQHTSRTLVDDGVLPIGVEFFLRYITAYMGE